MPHLKALVERHQDDPFAVIGINDGDSLEDYKTGLEDHGLTWISAYQGDTNTISQLYKISGFPTYFLIGADGKIVSSGHSGDAFDDKIAELVAALKKQ